MEAGRVAYAYALGELGIEPAQAVLVAVHPWDIHGAHEAGLMTAWVDRSGVALPDLLRGSGPHRGGAAGAGRTPR